MKKITFALICLLLLSSHDLYFKTSNYFMKSDQPAELHLFNGTIDVSENSIDRDRMISSKIVGPGYEFIPEEMDWYDKDNTTYLSFKTGGSGTYSAGVSTKGRSIELSAEEFNDYLEHDGVLDVLKERKEKGILDKGAVELYAKHVKVLFQVGTTQTDHYKTNFSYPVEFIPVTNPYKAKLNDEVVFEFRKNNKPVKDHLVHFGFEGEDTHTGADHTHEGDHTHQRRAARSAPTAERTQTHAGFE